MGFSSSITPALAALAALGLLTGCASSTIDSRREEKRALYESLRPEFRELVDKGQIAVGMPESAVYIAWGPPAQVLLSEDPNERAVFWLYHGTWMQDKRPWAYREVALKGGVILERFQERSSDPRAGNRAEIVLVNGRVARWRITPRPVN
jgi:hypothetical protein